MENAQDINDPFVPGNTIRRWKYGGLSKLRSDDESFEDSVRSDQPSDVENDQRRALVNKKSSTIDRELAEKLDVSPLIISSRLKEIEKLRNIDKSVPLELCKNPRNRRLAVCSALLLHNHIDHFLIE